MDATITATLTTAQIETAIRRERTRVADARTALSEARTYVANVERGPDADAVKAHKLSEYDPVLSQRERDAVAAADIADANLRDLLGMTGGDQPLLTEAELATANARRQFVKEDVADRSIPDLLAMTRQALVTDDRPMLYLLTRYLPRRLQESTSTWADAGSDADTETLRRLIREATARLRDGRLDPLAKAAQDVLSDAVQLETDARKRQLASRSYGFQTPHEVNW